MGITLLLITGIQHMFPDDKMKQASTNREIIQMFDFTDVSSFDELLEIANKVRITCFVNVQELESKLMVQENILYLFLNVFFRLIIYE
jgi:hypothetical protein